MWIFTPKYALSVIRHPGADVLTIRARIGGDLHDLQDEYLPELGEIKFTADTDYPYRAECEPEPFARALAMIALEIDYPNVKNATMQHGGKDRSNVYGRIHAAATALEELDPKASPAARYGEFDW